MRSSIAEKYLRKPATLVWRAVSKAEAYTGSPTTDLGFSYTKLGQMASAYQQSPNPFTWNWYWVMRPVLGS